MRARNDYLSDFLFEESYHGPDIFNGFMEGLFPESTSEFNPPSMIASANAEYGLLQQAEELNHELRLVSQEAQDTSDEVSLKKSKHSSTDEEVGKKSSTHLVQKRLTGQKRNYVEAGFEETRKETAAEIRKKKVARLEEKVHELQVENMKLTELAENLKETNGQLETQRDKLRAILSQSFAAKFPKPQSSLVTSGPTPDEALAKSSPASEVRYTKI